MTSRHQHTKSGTFAVSGDIDAAIAALDARLKKLEAPLVVPPPPSPYTLDLTFATMPPQLVPQYIGVNDWGDRLDTNMGAAATIAQSSIANGILTLACERKANPSGRSHVGACWSTYGTFAQKYGTFEARLRYDEAERTWPSFWLLPVGSKQPYPEIDICEAYGSPGRLGPGQLEQISHRAALDNKYRIIPVAPGWHVHKLVWTATRLDFYIDGSLTSSVTDVAYVPQVAMYVIVTWGVDPVNASGPAPDRIVMELDYIRVSQP